METLIGVAVTNYLNNNHVNPHPDGGDYNEHLERVCNMMGIYFHGTENGWSYDDINNKKECRDCREPVYKDDCCWEHYKKNIIE